VRFDLGTYPLVLVDFKAEVSLVDGFEPAAVEEGFEYGTCPFITLPQVTQRAVESLLVSRIETRTSCFKTPESQCLI